MKSTTTTTTTASNSQERRRFEPQDLLVDRSSYEGAAWDSSSLNKLLLDASNHSSYPILLPSSMIDQRHHVLEILDSALALLDESMEVHDDQAEKRKQ